MTGFRSVVVITSALHAEGRRFEPGREQVISYFSMRLQLATQLKAALKVLSQSLETKKRGAEKRTINLRKLQLSSHGPTKLLLVIVSRLIARSVRVSVGETKRLSEKNDG